MTDEVAFVFHGDHSAVSKARDIVVKCTAAHGSCVEKISTLHRFRDPLHYVLLFPTGEPDGFHLGLPPD